MAYLNAAQDVVIFLCNAHQLLFTTILVQRLGRRQRLLHVYSLRVRHDVRHALQQQIIGALDGRVALFVELLTLQILKDDASELFQNTNAGEILTMQTWAK